MTAKSLNGKTLLLLKPRGFCAGVVRAIDIVRIALETFGPPIYVRKEIVHNRFVVEELSAKGAIFVDSVDEVPPGERVIYSGIYRCDGCGKEISHNSSLPLPAADHHQHGPREGEVRWRLIVWAVTL